MNSEDRYYYVRYVAPNRQLPEIIKWNQSYTLVVEEDVDFRQYIELTAYKLDKTNPKAVSGKYIKVKPVIKEIFSTHYSLALKYIHEAGTSEGEFYLIKNSSDWYQAHYYSDNDKEAFTIEIDFRDSIEDLWLMFFCKPGLKGRPNARKKAVAITDTLFKQLLNLTIQFLYDPDSVPLFLNDYIKNFKLLCEGETNVESFVISAEKTFQKILQHLETRRESLQRRLVENDQDSTTDRIKLRGELDGIIYAIKTIKTNK